MRYLVRALKYFLQMTVLVTLIVGALMLAGLVSKDIGVAFKDGWKSVGYIALMLAAVSAVYPRFGYGKREIPFAGEFSEIKDEVIRRMSLRGYIPEKIDGENISFRLSSTYGRITRLFEDRISFERSLGGFTAEGLSRDLARVANAFRDV
ncbi:MAG: hypothetical protein IKR69_00915 [Bacteroidales bacterium]|nr:hypothetical protein [Bacteroidales bacterium]